VSLRPGRISQHRVIVPSEELTLVEFRQRDSPGIAVINVALARFEPKIVFAWHLSVMLHLEDIAQNGMPSRAECDMVDAYGELLDIDFKGDDLNKPNALFLARITWNKTRELIYRVYDPQPADRYLADVIDQAFHPRKFDYRIDHDPQWKLAEWHLRAAAGSKNETSREST
jgi:hypothetical protein